MSLAVTYIFSPTTTVKSAEVNQNFSDVVNYINNIFQPGIVFWFYGAVGSIPSAYYYCDGSNGTPNVKKRSIRGVGDGLTLGATGGAETRSLSITHMPTHDHGQGNHSHGVNDPGHYHTVWVKSAAGSGEDLASATNGAVANGPFGQKTGATTGIWLSASGAIITPQGSGTAFSTLDPYIALVPIMIK